MPDDRRPPSTAIAWNLLLTVSVGVVAGVASGSYLTGSNSAEIAQHTAQIAGMIRQLDTMSDHERRITAMEQRQDEQQRVTSAIADHGRRIGSLEIRAENQAQTENDLKLHLVHIDEQLGFLIKTLAHADKGSGG